MPTTPALTDLGLTKEDLFQNKSLYLEALSEDRNDELVVTMTKTKWSKMYYDFNDLDNSDLMEMARTALMSDDGAANMDFSEFSVFDGNKQAKFIKAEGTLTAENANGAALQYVTVVNGNAYTFTFDFYNGAITGDEEAMSEDVVSSINFDHIVKQDDGNNSDTFYIVVIAVMAVIIAALLYVIRKRKYTVAVKEHGEDPADNSVTPESGAAAAKTDAETTPETENDTETDK